ncbi:hypothetical protein ABW21_db0208195 [Orbilia brochopaga]|nr:hypothetical protein ABW21_db0208195 [Drechslerella brochopaga]
MRPPIRGGCTPDQIEILKGWWIEAGRLINNAYDLFADLSKRATLRDDPDTFYRQRTAVENLASWYNIRAVDPLDGEPDENGIRDVRSVAEDEEFYQQHLRLVAGMHDAIFGGGVKDRTGVKTRLYCSEDWAVLKDPEVDPMLDNNGNIVLKEDGTPLIMKEQAYVRNFLYNADGTRKAIWPFWLPDEHSIGLCLGLARIGPPLAARGNPESLAWLSLSATLSKLARERQNPAPVWLEFSTGQGSAPLIDFK